MKIYLVADSLTSRSLALENISIKEDWFFLRRKNQSILLVESAWQGYKNRWKYQIASYPDYPERTNEKLVRLVEKAKNKGIPTVFWNKEDSVHFERFIDSAKHFDHIFTVDQNAVEKYHAVVPATTTVDVAMFPVQPRIHCFQGFNFKKLEANFVGSFNHQEHFLRQERQKMLFSAALKADFPVAVFDRHSDRKSPSYHFPQAEYNLNIKPAVSYQETADIYRRYLVSLNVNTIEDSPTMCSRRVNEILACGGILVSTPSLVLEKHYKDYCYIVDSEDEAIELFQRLKYGASKEDLEKALAGSEFVMQNFTWAHFLQKVKSVAFG